MPQPMLCTPRLRLRPFGDADLPGFIDIYANPVTAHFLGGLCNDEDAWRRMATMVGHVALRGYGPWAVEEQTTGVFVGYCGPWNPHGWPEREIAWTLRSAFHGRGYATEAARAALAFAYEILNWDTAVSCIALDNADSIRVAERLGAVRECTTHNRGFQIGIYRHVSPAQLRQGALAGT
jgi:RimJ/RimL family protein N-acetyltransferase